MHRLSPHSRLAKRSYVATMFTIRALSLLAVVTLLAACGPIIGTPATPAPTERAATLDKVTIGVVASTADGGIFVAQDRGYFKAEGVDLEIQRYQTLVNMVPPLTSGDLQIASGALAASLFNAAARGLAVHVVADKGQTFSPEWDYQALVIRKDLVDSGTVKDYQDLRGLKLVTSGRGNSNEVTLAAALRRGGLTLQDVDFAQMGFPDMVAAFASGAVDGAIVVEPFVSRIVSDGTGVRWKSTLDILGRNQQLGVIVYGQQLGANRDLGMRWMRAYIRGVRDYNDAFGPARKDRDAIVRILTQNTTVTDPAIYEQMRPAGLDPDGRLDMQSIEEAAKYYVESGQITDQPDLARLIDPTFQQGAVLALGPYDPQVSR
jgi:NitT/TauT family transport system substrate-binding protein